MRNIFLLIVLFVLILSVESISQVQSSGACGGGCNWTDGATWVPNTPGGPTSASGSITIVAGDVINLNTNVTIDETTIQSGATLNVNFFQTLTIADGAGTDLDNQGTLALLDDGFFSGSFLTVNGYFANSGSLTFNNFLSFLTFGSGSTYEHQINGGTIPSATWNAASTLSVTGFQNSPITGFNQNFGNLIWACPSQAANADLGLSGTIFGDLSITNTNNNFFTALNLTGSSTITVNGSFNVSGGSRVAIAGSGSVVLDISNDFSFSSSAPGPSFGASVGTANVNVNGDINITSGTLASAAGPGVGLIFNIDGSLDQNFTSGGSLSGPVNFNIGQGTNSTLILGSNDLVTDGDITVNSGSTLDVGPAYISDVNSGTGSFTLNAGGTLRVRNTDGVVNSTSAGAVRHATNSRTYQNNSNIEYLGSSTQDLGSDWSGSGSIDGAEVNLIVDKPGGLLNNSNSTTSFAGNLSLINGSFDIGGSNTIEIGRNFSRTNGNFIGSTSSNLTFNGSGTVSGDLTFTSSLDLANLVIDRSNDITLGTDLSITTLLSFASSGGLDISGVTLNIEGDITQPGSGGLISDNVSTLAIGGNGALTIIPFSGSGNQLNNLFLNRTGGGTYSWSSTVEVVNSIFLITGTLDHISGLTPATNSSIVLSSGASLINNTLTGTNVYNVQYNGTVTTGLELPVSATRLNNLTIDGIVTLSQGAVVNGDFTIESGQLDFNGNVITMDGPNWIDNGGSLANSQVIFNTSTLLGGTGTHQFVNLLISSTGNLDLGSTSIQISGDLTNNGVMDGGTSLVVFNGTTNIERTLARGDVIRARFNDVIISPGSTMGVETQVGSCTVDCGDGIDTFYAIEVAGDFTVQSGGTFDPNVDDPADPGCEVLFAGTTHNISMAGESFANLGIEPNASVTLDEALVAVGSIVISANGTLSTGQFNQDISVGKDFRILGTFTPNQGEVTFNGDANQLITDEGAGSNIQFWDIDIDKSSGDFTFDCDIELLDQLTITTFDAGADLFFSGSFGNLVLRSTASKTARIATLPSSVTTGNTNGNLTVERYTTNSSNDRVYRYLSSPVTDGFVSDWKVEFPITGTFNDPSTQAEWPGIPGILENSPSMFRYDPSIGTTLDDRYESYPLDGTNSTASSLENGRGYAAFVRQTSPIVIDVTGSPAIGNVDVDVFSVNEGYNLVGNPYPAPINWDNVTLPAGVSTQISMRDNTGNLRNPGDYVYFSQGGASIPASYNGDLAIGQAFWVQTSSDATITFNEDDKVTSPNPILLRTIVPEDMIRLIVNGSNDTDELLIRFKEDATDGFDNQYDAIKRNNLGLNFSSFSVSESFAINTLPGFDCSKTVDLVLEGAEPGIYSITSEGVESFKGASIYLIDNFEGSLTLFELTTNYNFEISSDPETFSENRFDLLFLDSSLIDNSIEVTGSSVCDGDASVTLSTSNVEVEYYVSYNGEQVSESIIGNGDELIIPFSSESLESGENMVVVWASVDGCAEIPLLNTAQIDVNTKPEPPVLEQDLFNLCEVGSINVKASGALEGERYQLFNSQNELIQENLNGEFSIDEISSDSEYSIGIISENFCQSEVSSFEISYSVLEIPQVSEATVCAGESVTLVISNPNGSLSYIWKDNQGITLAENSTSLTLNELNTTTEVFVEATNSIGCSSELGETQVLVNTIPSIGQGDYKTEKTVVVIEKPADKYFWKLNGELVEEITGNRFDIEDPENKLEVAIEANGCKSEFVQVDFAVTAISPEIESYFKVYPNPTNGVVYLEKNTDKSVKLKVISEEGKILFNRKMEALDQNIEINLEAYNSGIYLVYVEIDSNLKGYIRLVKR